MKFWDDEDKVILGGGVLLIVTAVILIYIAWNWNCDMDWLDGFKRRFS